MAELWITYIVPALWITVKILLIVVPLLVAVAYLTWFERKVMASMQLRMGPNVVGPWGLLQPFADGIKMFVKETVIPTHSNTFVFVTYTFCLCNIRYAFATYNMCLCSV